MSKKTMRRCAQCSALVELPEDAAFVALADAAGSPLCERCFDGWRAKATVSRGPEPVVEQRKTRYVFTDDMDEISGFGGGYEQTCRNMLAAGLEWFDDHPDADPQFHGFRGIQGLIVEDNDDAKSLSAAVEAGDGGTGCTGAMHQAVIRSCLFIRSDGWERYCDEMRKRDGKEPSR